MENCYGNKIKELVSQNPLNEGFYQYLLKHNTNDNYGYVLLKNLTLQYLDVINNYIENFASISIRISSTENQEGQRVKFSIYCPEKEIGLKLNPAKEDLVEFLSELTKVVLDNRFYVRFCKNDMQEAFKNYIDALWNYYVNYSKTLFEYKLGTKDAQLTSYINLLLQDTDSGLLLIEQINFLISLFNNICQSLLKAEYLIYDTFAKDYLTDAKDYSSIEKERIRIANSRNIESQYHFLNLLGQDEDYGISDGEEIGSVVVDDMYKEDGQKSGIIDEDAQELIFFSNYLLSFFRSQCAVFKIDKKDNNYEFLSKGLLSCFIMLYRESKITPLIHYNNVSNMLADYSIFIEKIKRYTEIKQRQHFFNVEEHEQTGYENNVTLCTNLLPLANTVTALGKIMQYVFHLILDMCLIDHNYVSTDKNLTVLLRLHCILQLNSHESPNKYSFFTVLDALEKRPLINTENIKELKNTINLLRIKNDLLLLKMRKRSGYSLKDIVYHTIIPEQVENIHEKPYYLFLPLSQFLPDIKRNMVYEHYKVLLDKNSDNNKEDLKEYEQIFTEILCKNELDYEMKYDQLARALERPLHGILGSNNEKIYAYNNVIYFNFINHFIKYGRYIKKLKVEVKEKRNDDYLKEISDFIEANNESGMISCAFILKHLEWLDKVIKNDFLVEGQESDKLKKGFDYIQLAEILLSALKMLIRKLESDSYCMNYSSFFQDCFFKKEDNGDLVRMSFNDLTQFGNDFGGKESKNVFFLSSIWQPPVSLNILKRKHEYFAERTQLNATKFYQHYITTKSNQQNQEIQKYTEKTAKSMEENKKSITGKMLELLTENKKDTVQILGIFAAFLAIATVGLGDLSSDKSNPVNIEKRVISICACMGYFVLLLQLVMARRVRDNLTVYVLLILAIVYITIVFIMGLN